MIAECDGFQRKLSAKKPEYWNLKLKVEEDGGVTGKVVAHGTFRGSSSLLCLLALHWYQNQAILLSSQ